MSLVADPVIEPEFIASVSIEQEVISGFQRLRARCARVGCRTRAREGCGAT
jgi:hypothetical protein